MINGGMMMQAVYSLNDSMKQIGREVNADEITEIVQEHAFTTAVSAAASVAAAVAVAAAISFIPSVGSMASATLTAITNYGFVYLAGLIFIKMVAAMGVTRIENMSENELKAAANDAQNGMDVKSAMKEAKQAYKASV